MVFEEKNSNNNELVLFDSNNRPYIIDREDYDRISSFKWCINKLGYVTATMPKSGKKKILLHRFIMGVIDRNIKVDHINHKVNDNRKSNLRVCSHRQNLANSCIKNTNKSGVKGVCLNNQKNKWVAYGVYNYKKYHLGTFEKLEDAKKARKQWEKDYQKEFAFKENFL